MAEREIKVNIGGDTSDLDRALTKGQANLLRFAKIGAAAVAAVGVAMIGLTKQSLANIDALAKQARSLGLTTSALQKMAMVAGEAGVESGQLSSMLGLMQRNIIELQKGTKTQTDSFAKMGLSIKDLQGLSPDEQFRLIAEGLNGITDPAAKTAAAMDVFGRSGRAAINMMEDYSARAAEAAKFQSEWGITVSQFDSDRIEAANDAFGRLGMALTGVGNILAAKVAPLIISFSEGLLKLTGEGSTFRDVLGFISENLDVMANSVGVLAVALTAKAIPAIYAMVTSTGVLTASMIALRSALISTGIGALVVGVGYLIAKFVDFRREQNLVKVSSNGLTTAMGEEITQSQLLQTSLGNATAMSVDAAQKKLSEAKSRYENVAAIIAENRALAVSSTAFTNLTTAISSQQDLVRGIGTETVSNTSAYNEQRQTLTDLINKRQGLILADEQLGEQQKRTAENVAKLSEALENQAGGVVRFGGAVTPIAPDTTAPTTPDGEPATTGGAGGLKGGAGIANDMAKRLEALQEGLMTESEVVAAWYEESRMTLAEALEAELITRTEYNDAIQRLEAEHQDRMGSIREAGSKRGLQAALTGGAAILGAMGAMNKKAMKASQIFAAAEALISTYKGAAKELEKGVLGYATAAAVIAKGIGFVAAIKGVSASGGSVGGGGGGSSAAAAAPAPAQAPATTFAFTLQNDPMGFGEGFARQLIEQLNATQRNGGQIRGVLT